MINQTKVRTLLIKQIVNDIKDGDTTVLWEILENLDDDVAYGSLSDENQNKVYLHQLIGGELIRALSDVKCVSNSYSTPESIKIKKGSVLRVAQSATRMGDCFTQLVDGDGTIKLRGGSNEGVVRDLKSGATVGLVDGYNSVPYSLGTIDLKVWELV